jgi:hypothetical protein
MDKGARMSKHEIDIMWQQAMKQSIEDGEMFTRYHFAKLVAERALADSMREVQRLGQEIEQEPVAWITPDGEGFRIRFSPPTNDVSLGWDALYTTPPQRKPLTEEQRQELMSKAWNKWLSRKDDGRLFAWDFSFEVEAAHNIKEKT